MRATKRWVGTSPIYLLAAIRNFEYEMKRILFYFLLFCFISTSCYRPQMSISIQRQEQEEAIFAQLKNTPFRTGKLKFNGRKVLYAIAKDSSGNFRAQGVIQKREYDFIYLNEKLVRICVRFGIDKEHRGYYYFKDGEMVYKEEDQPNLVDVEEAKGFAEELLQKAKTR